MRSCHHCLEDIMQHCQYQTTGCWSVEVVVLLVPCRTSISSTWVLFRHQYVEFNGIPSALRQASCRTQHEQPGRFCPPKHCQTEAGRAYQHPQHSAGVWGLRLRRRDLLQ